MTLEYDGTISVGSTIADAITDENAGEILVLCSGDLTLRRYDEVTRSQNGSSASVLSGAKALVLLDNASAAVSSSSSSTIDIVELSSGYKQNYAGGATGNSLSKSQNGASDIGNKIALFTTTTSKRLAKFNGNTFTLSTVDVEMMTNDQMKTIIYKDSDRFIVATDGGRVMEIDSSGVVYKTISIDYNPHGVTGTRTSSSFPFGEVHNMTIDNNLLLVSTKHGNIQLWDWSTGTKLKSEFIGGGSTVGGLALAPSASGVTMAGRMYTTQFANSIFEYDFTIEALRAVDPIFYTDSTNPIISCGINSATSKAWGATSGSNDVHVFSLTPRSSTVRTITIPNNENAEVLLIKDDGAGLSKVILNTYITSPGNYRVPTGKTIYEIFKTGSGVESRWGASKYTT